MKNGKEDSEVIAMTTMNGLIHWPTVTVVLTIILVLIGTGIWLVKRNRRI